MDYGDKKDELIIPKILMSSKMIGQSQLLTLLLLMNEDNLLVVDELDRSLHPLVVKEFIKETMNRKVQVIFSSHNTHFLQYLRPDQIFFAKWKNNTSKFNRLSDINENIREVNNIEKMYLSGLFNDKE
ncbi:MAG TPA: AAA family ATPase [Bacilli bacterium]|jgi:predicted ATPase|nr:AAA family ATPase [Bacilli bacterium]